MRAGRADRHGHAVPRPRPRPGPRERDLPRRALRDGDPARARLPVRAAVDRAAARSRRRAVLCGASAADTRLRTVGYVARRLLAAEQSSGDVARSLRYVARRPGLPARRGVGGPGGDPRRDRRIFRDHRFHIVRVRLQRGARLLLDVGGPYVLAPASATVRGPGGARGRPLHAVGPGRHGLHQARAPLHRRRGPAPHGRAGWSPAARFHPGPSSIPAHGAVSYAGRSYRAVSFTGTAFPSGPLRISLLLPASA